MDGNGRARALLFMGLYFALAAFFLVKGYRLTLGAAAADKDTFWGLLAPERPYFT